jgi:hypothetical protein
MNHKVQLGVRVCNPGITRRSLSATLAAWKLAIIAPTTLNQASDALASASTLARQADDGLSTARFGPVASSNMIPALHLPGSLERVSTPAALAFLLLPNLKIL